MTQLENVLRIPPVFFLLLSLSSVFPLRPLREFATAPWGVAAGPALSPASLVGLFVFTWLWVLYEASVARTPVRPRRGRVLFLALTCGLIVFLAFDQVLYSWRGEPPALLLKTFTVTGFLLTPAALISIWLAAKSFREFEESIPGNSEWDPLLPILVLPIGIWFIHRRIRTMLDHPKLTDQRA